MNTFFAVSVDKSKRPGDREFFLSRFVQLATLVAQGIHELGEERLARVSLGAEEIQIDRHGQVIGFSKVLHQSRVHVAIRKLLAKTWEDLFDAGALAAPLSRDTQSLADVLRFILTFQQCHRGSGKQVSKPCSDFLLTLRRAMVAWISQWADQLVLAWYLQNNAAQQQAAPALNNAAQQQRYKKRKYIMVSSEAKWKTLVDARRVRASPTVVLSLRDDSLDVQQNTDLTCMRTSTKWTQSNY